LKITKIKRKRVCNYSWGDKTEKNDMGGASNTYAKEERRIQGFGGDTWRKETTREKIILRWIIRKWDVGLWTGSSWLRIGTGGGHL